MIPEDYKKSLLDRLRAEASTRRAEKEEKLKDIYNNKLRELRDKYKSEVENFVKALSG